MQEICRTFLSKVTISLTKNQFCPIDFQLNPNENHANYSSFENKLVCSVYTLPKVKSIKIRFGTHVRQARKRAGLNQEQVSERVGVFRSYLSRIETGTANPTLLVMDAIASALGTELWELLR
jgi:ribosome-binding protein aMBF1 (putative translation factor)